MDIETLTLSSVFDELIDYFEKIATPEQILAFQVQPATQERAEELLYKNRNNKLALDEFVELQQMLHFNRKMTALRGRAYGQLNRK
jgi:hypothetical protein